MGSSVLRNTVPGCAALLFVLSQRVTLVHHFFRLLRDVPRRILLVDLFGCSSIMFDILQYETVRKETKQWAGCPLHFFSSPHLVDELEMILIRESQQWERMAKVRCPMPPALPTSPLNAWAREL